MDFVFLSEKKEKGEKKMLNKEICYSLSWLTIVKITDLII